MSRSAFDKTQRDRRERDPVSRLISHREPFIGVRQMKEKKKKNMDLVFLPGVELVDDALESYNSEQPGGESRDPSEHKHREDDEGVESSGIG